MRKQVPKNKVMFGCTQFLGNHLLEICGFQMSQFFLQFLKNSFLVFLKKQEAASAHLKPGFSLQKTRCPPVNQNNYPLMPPPPS
jgi:hypothetical protein